MFCKSNKDWKIMKKILNENTIFLIVDDNKILLRALNNALELIGYKNIVSAYDGSEAVKILESEKIDFIISDFKMPKLTGIELLRHVRSINRINLLPFLLVTADARQECVYEAIEEGVNDFLLKPYDIDTLKEKINDILLNPIQKKWQNKLTSSSKQSSLNKKDNKEQSEQGTILVVDDTPTNIDIIVSILKNFYEIKVATNGEMALKIVEQIPIDLILLDIMMPNMDGYEVIKKLKSKTNTENIPVIFLSSKTETIDITKGFKAGAVDYVSKPANPAILKARVDSHLSLKKSRDRVKNQMELIVDNVQLQKEIFNISQNDIKQPLSAIINECESVILHKNDLPVILNQIKTIENSAFKILDMLINNVDLYKIEKNNYTPNLLPVNINEITKRIIEDINPLCMQKEIFITSNHEKVHTIKTDKLLYYSILKNLMIKIIKSVKTKTKIHIDFLLKEDLIILIKLNQILSEDLQFLFSTNNKGLNKKNDNELYIARIMLSVLKGDLKLESDQKENTTVILIFPIY